MFTYLTSFFLPASLTLYMLGEITPYFCFWYFTPSILLDTAIDFVAFHNDEEIEITTPEKSINERVHQKMDDKDYDHHKHAG